MLPVLEPSPIQYVPADEVRAQLDRVLSSSEFVNSARLCRFLRLAVDRTLAGAPGDLKEYSIGRDAFERGEAFDPRTDSIVRVEAQRLRRKLTKYYEVSGDRDRVLISVPSGSYVPAFEWRPIHASGPAASLSQNAVAVMPFESLSTNAEVPLFCAGTTEEIIHKLAKLPETNVLGLSTSLALQECRKDLAAACRRFGIATLIEGSVRKSGRNLRIVAKVVTAETGRVLWSKSFNGGIDEIFSIQDQIARAVTAAIRAPEMPLAFPEGHPPNLQAYLFYLKGRYTWDDASPERSAAALGFFDRAIELDPGFALAHTRLCDTYQWLVLLGQYRPSDVYLRCKQAVLEALRLDDKLADAHASLASLLCRYDWQWDNAMATADHALRLNRGCSFAWSIQANVALARAHHDAALSFFEHAYRLDPLSPRTNAAVGFAHWCSGNPAEALRWLQIAQEMNPNAFRPTQYIIQTHLSAGDPKSALHESARVPPNAPHGALAARAAALAANGEREEAESILARLSAVTGYVDPINLALVHLALGRREEAVDAIERAIEERTPFVQFLRLHPNFRELYAHPRYAGAVAKVLP